MRTADGNIKVFGSDYPESSLFATQEFIDKNPKTVQAVANAIVRAEKWIANATPQQVADNVPPLSGGQQGALCRGISNSRRCIAQNGEITPKGAQTVREVLAAFDPAVASAKIDLASTYDNRFVKKAAESQP